MFPLRVSAVVLPLSFLLLARTSIADPLQKWKLNKERSLQPSSSTMTAFNIFSTLPLVSKPIAPYALFCDLGPSTDCSFQTFEAVSAQGGIDTQQFLAASAGLVKFLGELNILLSIVEASTDSRLYSRLLSLRGYAEGAGLLHLQEGTASFE